MARSAPVPHAHPTDRPFSRLPSPVPRLSPQGTPKALPYPILRRLSSTSESGAAPRSAWLGAAPAGRPPRAGGAARAAGEGGPPAGERSRGAGAKSALNFLSAERLTPDLEARIARLYPLGRLGLPEDVAKAVTFLASDGASHITGQTLSVSGGYTMV